ncbi:cytochrome P450 2J2-like [Lissotriton helveticus]
MALLLLGELFVALLLAFVTLQFMKVMWMRGRLPPGPTPVPILGNLWTLGFKLHPETLMQIAKRYGNTFTVWLGSKPMVVLNGYEACRDALITHSEEFTGRPYTPFVKDFNREKGIISSNGLIWKEQRRFSIFALRSLGMGKRSLEERIQEEAQHLLDVIAASNGNPLDPFSPISLCVSNVISSVTFGHRFSLDDEIFHKLINATDLLIWFLGSVYGKLYDFAPGLMRRVPGPHQTALKAWRETHKYICQEIKMHQESMVEDAPRDFIDLYLTQLAKTNGDPQSTFDEESIVQVVGDLFLAGSETTTTALYWALLYMVAHPDIQDRVQKELDAVFGSSSVISYADREKLPYTNAVIHEIQRYSSISAVGVPRVCVKQAPVQGYQIEKGTVILNNLTSVLYDSDYWETPHQFNPSHFLDPEGKFVTREAFLPFSAGHRVCLGEKLARIELFIFFTSLLRTFTFQLPEGVTAAKLDSVYGAIMHPHPYKLCAVSRLKTTT